MSPPLFAIPPHPRWTPVPSAPPDVSATPQARVLSWNAWQAGEARAVAGCFGFELGGYTDELAQVLFDRTEPFAVRALPAGAAVVHRDGWKAHGFERRERLQFQASDAHGVLAFGFAEGQLQSCFAVCQGPGCEPAVTEAAFATPREPPPAPSLVQAAALGALAHPRPVALGVLLTFVLVLAALLFARGVRS